ncbi:MAG: hypothetical protein KGI50_07405 [Patescibacteria group bacterium]|nr:hypothetical protein [Patescibacteria group bacterium]MDE2438783.1 hypothetical protein [Patescibacteria group bacterium]
MLNYKLDWEIELKGGCKIIGRMSHFSPKEGFVILDGSSEIYFEYVKTMTSLNHKGELIDELQRAKDVRIQLRKVGIVDDVKCWEK